MVDDDVRVGSALVALLRSAGYVPEHATTVARALDAARAHTPDLALIDLRLDGESGLDLVAPLRRLSPGAAVFVITAVAPDEAAREVAGHPIDRLLGKGMDPDDLLDLVAAALG